MLLALPTAPGELRLDAGTTKAGEARIFAFRALPELAEVLERQRSDTSAWERASGVIVPWVFHRDGQKISKSTLHAVWTDARKAAALPAKYIHDFRRTVARNLRRAGVDEGTIMALCGWKTRSVFDRYNIVDTADQEEGLRKLATFRSGQCARISATK